MEPIVAQLVRDVVAEEFGGEIYVPETTARLVQKIGLMPPHLGAGMVGLTFVFDGLGRVRGGAYAQLDEAARRQHLQTWRKAPVGVMRDWVQFYEKMGTFVYWSVVEAHDEAP